MSNGDDFMSLEKAWKLLPQSIRARSMRFARAFGFENPEIGVNELIDKLIWIAALADELQKHGEITERYFPASHHGVIELFDADNYKTGVSYPLFTIMVVRAGGYSLVKNAEGWRDNPTSAPINLDLHTLLGYLRS